MKEKNIFVEASSETAACKNLSTKSDKSSIFLKTSFTIVNFYASFIEILNQWEMGETRIRREKKNQ